MNVLIRSGKVIRRTLSSSVLRQRCWPGLFDWQTTRPTSRPMMAVRSNVKLVEFKKDLGQFEKEILALCGQFPKLNSAEVSLESNFMSDLGLDSLDHIELVMSVEDKYGVEISDADAVKLTTPAELAKFMHALEWAADDDVIKDSAAFVPDDWASKRD